jgi:hypothetical protein
MTPEPRSCCTDDHLCDTCYSNAQVEAADALRYAPTNSYERDLAQLRAAMAPLSDFEQRYRAERLQALEAERADVIAHHDDRVEFETLSADDVKQYSAPNPYAIAIALRRG